MSDEDEPPEPPDVDAPGSTDLDIRHLARRLQKLGATNARVSPVPRMQGPDVETRDAILDIRLKTIYAYGLLTMMVLQLLFVNFVMFAYAKWGVAWEIEASVMQVWLVTTLAEIVGIILVVTKYLFPNRDVRP